MSTPGRVFVCGSCSAVAHRDPERRGCGLPRGWEHQDPTACHECVWTTERAQVELTTPVCGSCIGELLDAMLEAMRK